MLLRRLSFALLLPVMGLLATTAIAALPGGGHVKASLVAADASVQPGKPVQVAIRFLHDPRWHTYWVQPGTGLPTDIKWTLPAGWKAGDIQWPAPHVLKDKAGNIVGNGYEAEQLLPITLTPPADARPGDKAELKAALEWLECEEVCVPGSANVALTLAVRAGPPQPDPAWGEKIRATVAGLPRETPEWKITAARDAKTVVLKVTPTGNGAPTPRDLHFFSEDNLVSYDVAQTATPDGRGGFSMTLKVAPDAPDAAKLLGVLTSENGWLPGGKLRGLRVEVPFEKLAAGSAAATNAKPETQNPKPPARGGLAGTLLLALVGGLILNLMPCVFPVLGLKILGFVNQAGHQRARVVAHGLVFTLGVLVSFWALAAVLALLRASGDQLGWGFQLQSPAFVYALAVLLLVFGLNMSGVFEFGLSATAVGSDLQTKSGYAGSFFTGVLATVVATPCSAPFLAPALGAALAVSTTASFAIFTAIAFGLSTPYLLLSIFPQLIRALPRPGAWMETFKQFMAFPLYATVGYLMWVLAGQMAEDAFLSALFSLVLVAMAVWMYGRWHAPGAPVGRARFGIISLVLVGALGLWIGWPRTVNAAGDTARGAPKIVWEPWSPEAVARLREQGRIVYVDFTARWCATCQTNKKLVFSSDEVLKYFADHKIAALRADWTNQDPRITAELAAYNRSAVPFNLIWAPGKNEPIILPELLTPGIVLEALKRTEPSATGEIKESS
ncbi:MAG: protein-disulfide reductase DsbD family protein [Opitutaceae bacterium]|nr:protein-disulfide reductase DsbD family protein [Opitutaceae bacterium]